MTVLLEIVNNRGWASTVPGGAETHRTLGRGLCELQIRKKGLGVRLAVCLQLHLPLEFLQVVEERYEHYRMLGGIDLSSWRPRVVVVEVTRPNGTIRPGKLHPSEQFQRDRCCLPRAGTCRRGSRPRGAFSSGAGLCGVATKAGFSRFDDVAS